MSAQEVKARESQVQGQFGLHCKTVSKKTSKKKKARQNSIISLTEIAKKINK
jgi:hypothetical protein